MDYRSNYGTQGKIMNTTAHLTETWPEDTCGIVGIHGDLIRDIAHRSSKKTKPDGEQAEQTLSPTVNQDRSILAPLFPEQPRIIPRGATFTPLQEWEGYVTEIGEETFTARLLDLTQDGVVEEEEADFPIAEISDTDQSVLQPGAIFRWVIGYRRTPAGTKERVSLIVFRRLPAWGERELQENRRKAEILAALLQGE
jgi:hypothetical protein